MVPKKATTLIKPTAESVGLPEELVQNVVDFYWSEMRKKLTEANTHNIFIDSLGTFTAKPWVVSKTIDKYKKMIALYKAKTDESEMSFKTFSIIKELEIKITKLVHIQELIAADKLKQKSIKEKRNATQP